MTLHLIHNCHGDRLITLQIVLPLFSKLRCLPLYGVCCCFRRHWVRSEAPAEEARTMAGRSPAIVLQRSTEAVSPCSNHSGRSSQVDRGRKAPERYIPEGTNAPAGGSQNFPSSLSWIPALPILPPSIPVCRLWVEEQRLYQLVHLCSCSFPIYRLDCVQQSSMHTNVR